MNNTLRLRRPALFATILLLSLLIGHQAIAVDALLLQDTYVDSSKATTNNGTSGDLRVFKNGTATMRAFLKFTTDTLPPGTTAADVEQARLNLWVNSSSTIAGSITLTPVTAAWSESTLTQNTAANLTYGLPKHANLVISSIRQFISIDVTDWVRAWLSGTLSNEGFVIETGSNSTSLNLYFDSKESTLTGHEAQLEVSLVGTPGPAGPQGPTGATGPAGPTGAAGAIGPVGPVGPIGPQGPAGATGSQGLIGSIGPTGPQGLQGPQGIAGANGTTWYSLTGAPEQTLGALNDYYLDLVTGDLWQKVSSEGDPVWTLQGNIRGPAGAKGDSGDPGPAGPQGPAGPSGLAGASGPPGPQGAAGADGAVGPAGLAGPIGPQGPAGPVLTRVEPQGDLSMGEFTQGPTP